MTNFKIPSVWKAIPSPSSFNPDTFPQETEAVVELFRVYNEDVTTTAKAQTKSVSRVTLWLLAGWDQNNSQNTLLEKTSMLWLTYERGGKTMPQENYTWENEYRNKGRCAAEKFCSHYDRKENVYSHQTHLVTLERERGAKGVLIVINLLLPGEKMRWPCWDWHLHRLFHHCMSPEIKQACQHRQKLLLDGVLKWLQLVARDFQHSA